MKKMLLILSLMSQVGSLAQDFEFKVDTAAASTEGSDTYITIYNKVKNIADRTYTFTWRLLNHTDLLPTWSYNGFCDNSICYTVFGASGWFTGEPVESSDLAPGVESDFKLQLNIPASAENGTSILKFEVKTEFQTDIACFIAVKVPAGVSVIPVYDTRISVYPNPVADNQVKLYTSKELNIKDILIINSLGQVVSHMKASADEIHILDVHHLGSGIYTLELFNASGNKISDRKFIRK